MKDTQTMWVDSLNPATAVTLTTDVSGPQVEGTIVNITGQGAGGTGVFEYQFRVKGPATNDTWIILQDYSAVDSVNWNSTGFVGANKLQVKARNAGSEDKPVKKNRNFTITN